MFRFLISVPLLILVLAAQSAQATTPVEDRQSLLSCKFGPDCTRGNAECSRYATWIILRYYEAEGRYTLFDALQSTERGALVREMGAMTIFEVETIGDGETQFGRSYRMVVGPTLEAAVQSASVARDAQNDLAFSSEAHGGMCRVIE